METNTVLIGDSLVREQGVHFTKKSPGKRIVSCFPGAKIAKIKDEIIRTKITNRESRIVAFCGSNDVFTSGAQTKGTEEIVKEFESLYEVNQEIHFEPNVEWRCNITKDPDYTWTLSSLSDDLRIVGTYYTPTLLLPRVINPHVVKNLGQYPSDVKCEPENFRSRSSEDDNFPFASSASSEMDKSKPNLLWNLIRFYNYDRENVKFHKKTSKSDASELRNENVVSMSNQLNIGTYSAQLIIKQRMSQSYSNKTFKIVNPPISVQFIGGSVRYATRTSSLVLSVEVRASLSASYKLSWSCEALAEEKRHCWSANSIWPFKFQKKISTNNIQKLYMRFKKYFLNDLHNFYTIHDSLTLENYQKLTDYLEEHQELAVDEEILQILNIHLDGSSRYIYKNSTDNYNKPGDDKLFNSNIQRYENTSYSFNDGSSRKFLDYLSWFVRKQGKIDFENEYLTYSKGRESTDSIYSNYNTNDESDINRSQNDKFKKYDKPKYSVADDNDKERAFVLSSHESETNNEDPKRLDYLSYLDLILLIRNLISTGSYRNRYKTTVETLTIPVSLLRPNVTSFLFRVEVKNYKEKAAHQQVIAIMDEKSDSIGILQTIPNQRPLGSTRRAVYESQCYTCSEEDLKNMEYKWTLKEAIVTTTENEAVPTVETYYDAEVNVLDDASGDSKAKTKDLPENDWYHRDFFLDHSRVMYIVSPRDYLKIRGEHLFLDQSSEQRSKRLNAEDKRKKVSFSITQLQIKNEVDNKADSQFSRLSLSSVPFSYSFSACFPLTSSGIFDDSSFFRAQWEKSSSERENADLNASACSQLVLLAKELFKGKIKFSQVELRRPEGGAEIIHLKTPLSPEQPSEKHSNMDFFLYEKIHTEKDLNLFMKWIRSSIDLRMNIYPMNSGKNLSPTFKPSYDDVKGDLPHLTKTKTTPQLGPSDLLVPEISRNPNVNSAPKTVPDKLPLSAKSIKEHSGVMPSDASVHSGSVCYNCREFSIESPKYSDQVFHKENLVQNSPRKNSKFQTIGKSSNFAQSFSLSPSIEEQRQNEGLEGNMTTIEFIHVFWFNQITSSGTEGPEVVIHTACLNSGSHYVLTLQTHNPLKGTRGKAIQILTFSPSPVIDGCHLTKLSETLYRSWCRVTDGVYYPVKLLYNYHFIPDGLKTAFYFGSLPWIDFTLPSGLASTNYTTYISIEAVDSYGVSTPYPSVEVNVEPRYITDVGIASLFLEITSIYAENPALELQHIRTLAWELNILPPSLITHILDTILALTYQDICEHDPKSYSRYFKSASLGSEWKGEKVNDPKSFPGYLNSSKRNITRSYRDRAGNFNLFVRANLLKSCGRDQLAMKISKISTRDEMEVLMMITSLTVLMGASEAISWFTFQTVVNTMLIAKDHHMLYWDLQSEIRSEIAQQYFLLSSEVLEKEYEIYDCPSVPNSMINTIVSSLFDVMIKEITSSIGDTEPVVYASSGLKLYGYMSNMINFHNVWSRLLPFSYMDSEAGLHGIYTVMGLLHSRSPYANTSVEINTEVLHLQMSWKIFKALKNMQVNLTLSGELNTRNYDFRKKGALNFNTMLVYSFDVTFEDLEKTLMITLEVTKVYTPVSAVMMICNDMQSLDEPLKQQYLYPTDSYVSLMIFPGELPVGTYVLLIVDTNSVEAHYWPISHTKEDEQYGIDFLLGAWWSECYVWNEVTWVRGYCTVLESSTWDMINCLCSSESTIYGAVSIPLLTTDDAIPVNELMLISTFVALYFIIFLLLIYVVLVFFFFRRGQTPVRRQNLWLRENNPSHTYAYLLTINTGAQRNAGTSSNVYAILHGTDAMSPTRELQSKCEGRLFTRGSICSFIWTSPEPLGDILSVQLWHDCCDDTGGWFVCEVSVADLVTGATFVYPCYKWLSVTAEDAQVMREITLEKPTTYCQDFKNWLPQYVSEHTLWYSVFTAGSSERFFRLQSLTIFVTVWLLFGTVALNVVQYINSSHTMMTPDPHIETLYFGLFIAIILLPVQWLLRLVFRVTNKLEERTFYKRIVKDMVTQNAEKPLRSESETRKEHEIHDREKSGRIYTDDDVWNPESELWKKLKEYAYKLYPDDDDDDDGKGEDHVSHTLITTVRRRRKSVNYDWAFSQLSGCTTAVPQVKKEIQLGGTRQDCKLSKTASKSDSICICIDNAPPDSNKSQVHLPDREARDVSNEKQQETYIKSTTVYSYIGWLISLCCVALCSVLLYETGYTMPQDYSSLWIQTVFTAMCASAFVVQPLSLAIFAVYKVCVYRFFGYRGIALFCKPVSLDQPVTVWNHYKNKIARKCSSANELTIEQSLQDIQRERELRFAHPPSEQKLLRSRNRIILREQISSLFRSSIGYVTFLFLLVTIMLSFHLQEQWYLNNYLRNSAVNGSCINRTGHFYIAFADIVTSHDWWKWTQTELLDLAYNLDDEYAPSNYLFCASNSIILGTPLVKRYYVNATSCESDDTVIYSNSSVSDTLEITDCYPDYEMNSNKNSDTLPSNWDAQYLAVVHGQFADYGVATEENVLPRNRDVASLYLLGMQTDHLARVHQRLRALITEFTLFHPQTRLYSVIHFIAEFPASSGALTSLFISSSFIDKYNSFWQYASKIAELILVAIAMIFCKRTAIQLFKNRGRFWSSFWDVLDLLTTVLCWFYVISSMLRVEIAECLLWELKINYYQSFVSLKSLMTWNKVSETIAGFLMAVHILRCLWLFSFFPNMRKLGQVLSLGTKEAFKISFGVFFFVCICAQLGLMWFRQDIADFSTFVYSMVTIIKSMVLPNSFYKLFSDYSGIDSVTAHIFFIIVFVVLFFMIFGIYVAIFIHFKKHHVFHPRAVEISWKDITNYLNVKWKYCPKFFKKEINEEIDSNDDYNNLCLSELEMLIDKLSKKIDSIVDVIVEKDDPTQYSSDESPLWKDESDQSSTGSTADDPENAFGINMKAFDEVTSAPSEIAATTINFLEDVTRKANILQRSPKECQEHFSRFLDDVTTSSETLPPSSYGKYGKSILKVNRRKSFQSDISGGAYLGLSQDPTEPLFTRQSNKNKNNKELKYFSPEKIHIEGIEELLKEYGLRDDSDDNDDDKDIEIN